MHRLAEPRKSLRKPFGALWCTFAETAPVQVEVAAGMDPVQAVLIGIACQQLAEERAGRMVARRSEGLAARPRPLRGCS